MKALEQRLRSEADEVDLVEIWLDSIEDLRLAEIFFEEAEIKTPFLFVNKAPCEGGAFMGTEAERVGVLEEMLLRGAQYVDVALETDPEWIERCMRARNEGEGQGKVILSYHNFKETPPLERLKELVMMADGMGADFVKLATFIHEPLENVTLFNITRWAREQGMGIITMGMGEAGRMSRVVCPLLGSALYYAPLKEGSETAPGQFTVGELKEIWERMG